MLSLEAKPGNLLGYYLPSSINARCAVKVVADDQRADRADGFRSQWSEAEMATALATRTHRFKVVLVGSVILAFWGWYAPQGRMPLDIHAMLWRSIPLSCLWALIVAVSASAVT
jgi:hypothetical protein